MLGVEEGYPTFYYSQFCKSAIGIDNDQKRVNEWAEFENHKIKFLKKMLMI